MYADPSGHWPKLSNIGKTLARNASTIGAIAGIVAGAVAGVAVATIIIATAPVSVPVIAAAAVGVGVMTLSAAIGGLIGNGIEKHQNEKDYEEIISEQEDVERQLEEYYDRNEGGYATQEYEQISRLEEQRIQIEQKKKNICEKTAQIQKQEDIYANLGYAGIGLIAIGLAPISGPMMAEGLGLGTAMIGGSIAVSDAMTVGAGIAGAMGTTYHISNMIESETGTNPVENYIYNGDSEAYEADTAALDAINMTSVAYGMVGAATQSTEGSVNNLGDRYNAGASSNAGYEKVSGKYSNLDEGLNFSNKASQHMGESGRQVPVQTLQDAIRYGEAMPDPRGSNATMYYTTMYKNGKMYNLEVLYDATTNTVYHFEYARKAMGNLSAIK